MSTAATPPVTAVSRSTLTRCSVVYQEAMTAMLPRCGRCVERSRSLTASQPYHGVMLGVRVRGASPHAPTRGRARHHAQHQPPATPEADPDLRTRHPDRRPARLLGQTQRRRGRPGRPAPDHLPEGAHLMSCKPGDHDYTDCTRFNCAVALAEEGGTQP